MGGVPGECLTCKLASLVELLLSREREGLGWAWLACREEDRFDPNEADIASVPTVDVGLPASWQTWKILCDTCSGKHSAA